MKIIVTGGAGFIGSHVVDAYIKKGHQVVTIDNLSTGFRRNLNRRAKFYKADIRNLKAVLKIFQKEKPTVVNHHAAIAEVVKSLKNPLPTYEVNILGTANVLLAFSQYGRGKNRRFIFSSTGGAVYGDPEKIPVTENTPLKPISPYGLSKVLGEEVIKFYSRIYDFDYVIFRYPNVYGPRQNPKGEAGVVAIFHGLMRVGKRPAIFGDGTKTRDYCHVEDVVRANVIGLRRGRNEILNIGWGKKISDQMIFDALAKELGFKKPPIYAPFKSGEVYRIAIRAEKAKRVIGWKPRITLSEGIRKYSNSF
ncbi:MAG: UDP-glucose 4-epimerase [Candidatus Jorgensenbacteria bacterium GW2011_GWC1_48_8]|uniref:UDP-glucose 4-epimerase n=1 Tax=Candidatus Jorgensenbacteria bacterium GW2011_GWC1_48_8 TaxID=1618666 RepID=A0A0G1X7F4_9BACT|nr:MAG: UDP-glucose 4-epimerase [Candidatus Jorgensenbacteria bacterium GW2011_GWC1_48_8]